MLVKLPLWLLPRLVNTVNALGELAGKRLGSGQGKKIKFTAPCHGVMMTIFLY